MGAVYEVTHPEFPRSLALKVIKGDVPPNALARFGREGQLLAKIRHPGVVTVHTLGRTSSGDPYLVTDYVQGQELRELIKLRSLEPRRCAELVRDLAAALEVVHAAGVIHRDLKPANVIVTPSGAPVLLDFGVARGAGVETLTQTGAVIGTLHYMSPEQAEATGPIDPRTDVYSLGAILFFLLTKLPPYPGSGVEVLAALVNPTRELPDPREHDPQIPAELAELCRRAIARSPQDRTPTAAALRAELDAWLAQEAAPPSPPQAPRAAALLLGLLLVGLGLGGLAAWALPSQEPAPQPPRPTPTSTRGGTDPSPTKSPSLIDSAPDPASEELDRLQRVWNHARERPQEPGVEPKDRPSPDPAFPEDTLVAELEAWLAANPDHRQASRAQALSLAARRALPIRVLDHGPTPHSPSSGLHFVLEEGRHQLLARTWQRPELVRWETRTWQPLAPLGLTRPGGRPYHDRPEASLILPLGPTGGRVLLGGKFGGALYEITLADGSLKRVPLPTAARSVLALARSPSGRIAVGTERRTREGVVTDPGSVHLLDPAGALLRSWELGASVASLAFPSDETLLGYLREQGGDDPSVLVRFRGHELDLERLPLPLRTSGFYVTEGQLLVGGVDGELLQLSQDGPWALPPAMPRRRGPGVKPAPLNAFAARGQVLFTGYGGAESQTPTGSRELVLWRRTQTEYVQARRIGRPIPLLALALSPEGRYLAARGRRNRIEIWDAEALAGE